MKHIRREKIENYSHKQIKLDGLVPYLKNSATIVDINQSMTGNAPKVFMREYEYGTASKNNVKSWPAYIAKVGHKWYPVESITEQLLTDLGIAYGLNMASSKLVLASGQLRFISKYFLKRDERLMHGAEIYAAHLRNDLDFVEDVEKKKESPIFFTVTFTFESLNALFPKHHHTLAVDFIRMLTFDALTGNNDRHFFNWGVITNTLKPNQVVFSPIYDTARALFWNYDDNKLKNEVDNGRVTQFVKKYCENSKPKIGIEQSRIRNHFEFIKLLVDRFPQYKSIVCEVVKNAMHHNDVKLIETNYRYLLSENRRSLINDCLNYRKNKLFTILDCDDQENHK